LTTAREGVRASGRALIFYFFAEKAAFPALCWLSTCSVVEGNSFWVTQKRGRKLF